MEVDGSEIDLLLNSLDKNDNGEAVQENLGEIKKHLIQFAAASRNVLKSKEFFNNANS